MAEKSVCSFVNSIIAKTSLKLAGVQSAGEKSDKGMAYTENVSECNPSIFSSVK